MINLGVSTNLSANKAATSISKNREYYASPGDDLDSWSAKFGAAVASIWGITLHDRKVILSRCPIVLLRLVSWPD